MKVSLKRFLLCFALVCSSLLLHAQVAAYKKHGRNVVKHNDGSVSVGRTRNYEPHGKWYTTYPNHTHKHFGKYDHGKAVGRHTSWWPNGQQKWIVDYEAGVRNGTFIAFDSSGENIEVCHYKNGVLSGAYYRKDTTDNSWIKGEYSDGVRSGLWSSFIHDSTIACYYDSGKKSGSVVMWTSDTVRTQGFYKNDIRDSVWREYKSGKLVHEYWYANGIQYKTDKLFFADSDSAYCETRYSAPEQPSMFIVYQKPGVPGKTEWYSNFTLDSIHLYHPNGNIHLRIVYRKGYYDTPVLHMANYVYNEEGQLTIKTLSGTNGKDSLRYDYGTNGNILRVSNFSRGRLLSTTYYYQHGKTWIHYAEDSIRIYSAEGQQYKMGSTVYSREFLRLDSIENSFGSIPVFNDPDAPAPPDMSAAASKLMPTPPVLAEFPGGLDSLKAFLRKTLKYPRQQLEDNVEGIVHVKFTVEVDGTISNPQVVYEKPVVPAFSREALRVVRSMPKWKPAQGSYGPEKCYFVLPIKFSLE